ncbi:MAG: aminotransferase class V-fold PLP-dependent enzyme [Thermoanaerobaculales bacterium]|nr:aminotransferase class V-fold PLP-dependent enzyme [Thermoanaerobaculales bacterium]
MSPPPAIYLDHGATAFPKAPGVAEAMVGFLEQEAGNPGRGGHRLTVAASRAIEAAREAAAALLGGDPERCLLGPGATFWLNTVLASRLRAGSRVVTSALEHNAVMRPLRRLEAERGVEVAVVEAADPCGVPAPDEMAARVAESPTALVVLTHASNVSGEVLPAAAIAAAVAPVPVLVDAAQSAGALPIDFSTLGAAALACSGHKGLLGPPGIGLLLLARGFEVEPLLSGGTGSRSESEEMPEQLPDRLEAGTPNGVGAAGLGAACRWLSGHGVEAVRERQQRLVRRLADALREIPGVRLHGWRDGAPHTGILSFTVAGLDGGELAARLDRAHGICVRAGLHCAPAAHRRLGTFPDGSVRVGIGPFNSDHDVDALLKAVADLNAAGGR